MVEGVVTGVAEKTEAKESEKGLAVKGGEVQFSGYGLKYYQVCFYTAGGGSVSGKHHNLDDLRKFLVENVYGCVEAIPVFKNGCLSERVRDIREAMRRTIKGACKKNKEGTSSHYLVIPHDGSSERILTRKELIEFLKKFSSKEGDGVSFDLISPLFLAQEDLKEEEMILGI